MCGCPNQSQHGSPRSLWPSMPSSESKGSVGRPIDTVMVDSLKVLEPKRPIREAGLTLRLGFDKRWQTASLRLIAPHHKNPSTLASPLPVPLRRAKSSTIWSERAAAIAFA